MEDKLEFPFTFSQIRNRDVVIMDLNPPDPYRARYRNSISEIQNLCSAGGCCILNRPVSYHDTEFPCIILTIMGHHLDRDVTTSFLIVKYSVYLVAYTLGADMFGHWEVCRSCGVQFDDVNMNYSFCHFNLTYSSFGLDEYYKCLGREVLLSALYILHTGDGDKRKAFEAVCHNIAEPVRILKILEKASAGMNAKDGYVNADQCFKLVNIWATCSDAMRYMYDHGDLPESSKDRLHQSGITEKTLRFVIGMAKGETEDSQYKRLAEGREKNKVKFKNIKVYKGNLRLKKRRGSRPAHEREQILDRWLNRERRSPDVWRCLYRILVEPDDRLAQYIANNSNILIQKPDCSVIHSYTGDRYEVTTEEMNVLRSF